MRLFGKLLRCSASFVFLTSMGYGATITGTVKGPDGAPFEGAFIQSTNTKTRVTVHVLSGRDGRYRVEELPDGNYTLHIRAIGYRADPQSDVSLAGSQHASVDFSLQAGTVRWSDLSYYQGKQLFPEGKGRAEFVGTCFGCHGFETRMAAVHRDLDGWRDRVNYMKEVTHYATWKFTDEQASLIATYLNSLFGAESVLPNSPADLPAYRSLVRHFDHEAMHIVYVEYDMPGPSRMPWNANPTQDGNVWIPYLSPFNGIAKLNPRTGEVNEYKAPDQGPAFIHSAVQGPDGAVWFSEQATNKLGRWDRTTQEITEYQDVFVPADKPFLRDSGSKHTVRIDSHGIVWSSGVPLTSFDPKTKKFTEYPVSPDATIFATPSPGEYYGIDIDKDDNVWFDRFSSDGKLYKADGTSRKISGYQPPTAGMPRRIQVDSDGIVWVAEFRAGKIARFDPKTQTFKEFTLPGPDASPYAIGIDKNHAVWYSSEQMDIVGRLDPKTGQVVEYPFPQSENTLREFLPDSMGRMWFASPANNKVGYFYLAETNEQPNQ